MTIQNTESVASGVTVEPGKVLSFLGLSPADPRSQALVAVCQRYSLDPLLKHVVIIPKAGPYITRDGLLHIAHRSGQLDGIVVDQEPTLSEDGKEWTARVTVYRKDMRHGFTFPGRYPVNGGNRDYAQEMAMKAAESHALRRAFDVTGIGVEDERRPEKPAATGGLATVVEPEPAAEVVDTDDYADTLDIDGTVIPAGDPVSWQATPREDWPTRAEAADEPPLPPRLAPAEREAADARLDTLQRAVGEALETRTGLLAHLDDHEPGSGYLRRHADAEVTRARTIRELLTAGVSLQTIRDVIDQVLDVGHFEIGNVRITVHHHPGEPT